MSVFNYTPKDPTSNKYLCQNCIHKDRCIEACKSLNEYLRKQGIYSDNWIRPKMPSHKRKAGNKWRELPFPTVQPPKNGPIG